MWQCSFDVRVEQFGMVSSLTNEMVLTAISMPSLSHADSPQFERLCTPKRFALCANLRAVQIYNSGESVCNPVGYGVDVGAHAFGRRARWRDRVRRASTKSRHPHNNCRNSEKT